MTLPSLQCLAHAGVVATGTLFNFPPSDVCPICMSPLFGCKEAKELPKDAPDDAVDEDDWTRCEPSHWAMRKDGPDVQRVIALRCGHMFHVGCMRATIAARISSNPPLPPNCPTCRAERESLSPEVLMDLGLDPATFQPQDATPSTPPQRQSSLAELAQAALESPPAAPPAPQRRIASRARNLFPEPEPFPEMPTETPGSPSVRTRDMPPSWFIDLLLMESVEAYQAMHAALRELEAADRLASVSEEDDAHYRNILEQRQERRRELQMQAVGPVAREHRRRIRDAYTELSPRGESVPPFTDAQGESMLRWMRDQLAYLRSIVIEDMEGGRSRYESTLQMFQRLLDRARRVQRIFVNDTFPGLRSSVVARLREGRDLARAYFLRGLRFYLGLTRAPTRLASTTSAILLAVLQPRPDESYDARHWANDLLTATGYLNLTNYNDDDAPVPEPIPPLVPSSPNPQYVGVDDVPVINFGPDDPPPVARPTVEDVSRRAAERIYGLEQQLADAQRRLEEAQRRTAEAQEAAARMANAAMQRLQVSDEDNEDANEDDTTE